AVPKGSLGTLQGEEVPVAGRVQGELRLIVIEELVPPHPRHGGHPVGAGRGVPVPVDDPDPFHIPPAHPHPHHQGPVGTGVGPGRLGTVKDRFASQDEVTSSPACLAGARSSARASNLGRPPAGQRSSGTRSSRSQGRSRSDRPKWPYAATWR